MKRTVSAKNLLIERAHLLESSPNNLHNALCILSTTFVIILVTNLIHFTLSFYGEHMTRVMRTIFDAKNSINDCSEGHYSFCSSTMQCLKYNQRCDRFQDCPDDADEINCVCLKEEYQCKNGRCISMQFLCDKVNDCPSNDDEDEQLCGKCGKSFFQCKGVNGKCVPEEKMCDGKFDCREGEDEDECFSLSKKNDLIFKKTFFGGSLVCYEGWKKEIDNNICELLSRGSSIRSFPSINTRLKRFVEIRRINETLTLAQKSRCPKDEIVTLICEERECGKRKINEKYFSGYIINGIETMNGEIPWQVSLKSDFGVCGGSLIAPQWVLTASHCVYKKGQVSKSLIAFFGSNFLASRNWVASGVIKVIPYFNSDYRENFDVALLKLVKTLSFNNYIQPICLPHKRFIESDYLYCISTGFGTTTKDFSSPILLKQRMRARKAASRGTLCIGTYTGQKYPNLCMGDSGGPFACRSKSQDKWTLVGVHKKVAFNRSAVDPKRPATLCQESYVTLVETMNDWINKQMEEN